VTLHITTLAGGNALSTFRAQQLQPALEAIHPKISGIAARFVHLVATDAAPTPPEQERLAALLTYGDPYAGPRRHVLIVTPRLGTLSPWASKATDIARNCGMAIRRVERITEYRISLKAGCWARRPS
jgi:phosphoribosylformylglycinamidine synthase